MSLDQARTANQVLKAAYKHLIFCMLNTEILKAVRVCNVNGCVFLRARAEYDGARVSGGEGLVGCDLRNCGAGDSGCAPVGCFVVVSAQTAGQAKQHTCCVFLFNPHRQFRVRCARYEPRESAFSSASFHLHRLKMMRYCYTENLIYA